MKFRLKMDLSEFYDDERNLAYILVDPNWNQVECLQQHVQRLFDVPQVQFLTHDGIYIPPRESIDVIKVNDILKAIVPHKCKKKSKSSCIESVAAPTENSLEINGDKRKCDDDEEGLTCSTPNHHPKKKQKTSKKIRSNGSFTENQSSINDFEESAIEALQGSNTVTSTIGSKEPKKVKQQEDHPGKLDEDTIKTTKRKRSRKNKKSPEAQKPEDKSSRFSSVPIPISSSTLRLSKSMSTPNQSTKHVHFSDDDSLTIVENAGSRVVYRSLLNMECEARVVEPQKQSKLENNQANPLLSTKPTIQIHENIVLVPAPVDKKLPLSPHEPQNDDNCSVIEVDDSIVKFENDAATKNCSTDDINVERILPLSEELTDLPSVGDVILFKMYKLSKDCTPEVSKYICARCEQVDSVEMVLNCIVLDGINELDENVPSIDLIVKSEEKQNGKLTCFQFFFNELLEKRVFRM